MICLHPPVVFLPAARSVPCALVICCVKAENSILTEMPVSMKIIGLYITGVTILLSCILVKFEMVIIFYEVYEAHGDLFRRFFRDTEVSVEYHCFRVEDMQSDLATRYLKAI